MNVKSLAENARACAEIITSSWGQDEFQIPNSVFFEEYLILIAISFGGVLKEAPFFG